MRPLRQACLSFTALLALAACGDQDAPDPDPSTADIQQALATAQKRLATCAGSPWVKSLPTVRGPIASHLSRIQNHLFHATTADPTSSAQSAHQLLEEFRGLEPLIALLERLNPTAHRIWQAEHDIQTMLARMDVPADAPFPLRTRFQSGWRVDRGTHIGYLVVGLEAMMSGRQDDKLLVGAGNLDRIAAEGDHLRKQLQRISRPIDILQAKLVGLKTRVAWGREVVERATKKGSIAATVLKTISAAADAAEKDLPDIKSRWGELKPAFARTPNSMRPAVTGLIAETDAHLLAVSKAGHKTAIAIGMLGSGR